MQRSVSLTLSSQKRNKPTSIKSLRGTVHIQRHEESISGSIRKRILQIAMQRSIGQRITANDCIALVMEALFRSLLTRWMSMSNRVKRSQAMSNYQFLKSYHIGNEMHWK